MTPTQIVELQLASTGRRLERMLATVHNTRTALGTVLPLAAADACLLGIAEDLDGAHAKLVAAVEAIDAELLRIATEEAR